MEAGKRIGESAAGLAVTCAMITGCGALLAGAVAFLGGEHVAVGLCFIAAALAFGLVTNATLRS